MVLIYLSKKRRKFSIFEDNLTNIRNYFCYQDVSYQNDLQFYHQFVLVVMNKY